MFIRRFSSYSKIGFIGLGNMGSPMVMNLRKKFDDVAVYDVSKSAVAGLTGTVKKISDFSEFRDRDAIFLMLPDAKITSSVLFSNSGLIEALPENVTIINSGTIGVTETKNILLKLKGQTFVDAPVSGGTVGAKEATLTFMTGGSSEVVDKLRPVLLAMGKQVIYCGEAGMGQAAKMCNNMLLAITMEGVSETFALAKNLDLDPNVLTQIINSSSGRCWSVEVNNPVPGIVKSSPASNNYAAGFSSKLLMKDMRIALAEAKKFSIDLPTLRATEEAYEQMMESDPESSGKDMSIRYQFISNK